MLIGYMRVSTGEQNLDLQRDGLQRAGCEKIYDDVCSGRATDRPGLSKAMEIARAGDALVVWKLDRIGRSLPHVVGLMNDLQQRGIGLKVLTGDMDTTTTTGRLVFGIFATLAEFERDLIHERTMAGLAAARARGRAGPPHELLELLTVVTAANINAVEAKHDHDRERLAHADQLAVALKLDMKSHWEAQAPFLSRLSKVQITEVMEDAGCAKGAIKAAGKAPKAEAVALAEKALAGKAWLPGPLRSNVDDEQQNHDDLQAMAAG